MTKAQLVRLEAREDRARGKIEEAVLACEDVLETCSAAEGYAKDNPVLGGPPEAEINVALMEAQVLVAAVEHVANLLQAAAFVLVGVSDEARKLAKRYR